VVDDWCHLALSYSIPVQIFHQQLMHMLDKFMTKEGTFDYCLEKLEFIGRKIVFSLISLHSIDARVLAI
jgi:hypothetical protein